MELKKPRGRPRGRPKGSVKAKNLEEKLAKCYPNYDPIIAMVEIALDPENPVDWRFRANKEIAQYLYPKRKAIEVTGKDGAEIPMKLCVSYE